MRYVILTPPTKHLCLEVNGIILSNCFEKWCLTGLEKGLAAVKKELDYAGHAPLLGSSLTRPSR